MAIKYFLIAISVITLLSYFWLSYKKTDSIIGPRIKFKNVKQIVRHSSPVMAHTKPEERKLQVTNVHKMENDENGEKFVLKEKSAKSNSLPHYLLWDHRGKLGNNMFEYASSYCVAIHSNHVPTISSGSRLWLLFKGIKATSLSKEFRKQNLSNATTVHERGYAKYNDNIKREVKNISSPVHTDGYLQSHKYFASCNNDIRKQFTLTDNLQDRVHYNMVKLVSKHLLAHINKFVKDKNMLLESNTVPQEITYIGVHTRAKLVFSEDYISKAMDYFRKKYKNVLFLICTDSPTWLKSYIEAHQKLHHDLIQVTDEQSDFALDFGTLVNCNHSLISGGTFSWWSGWLAGGEVVYPKGYAEWHSQHEHGYIWQDYYPDHWTPM